MPEYLFEFVPRGRFIKVSVIDPAQNLEVSILGDSRMPRSVLERLALRKLFYVQNRRTRRDDGDDSSETG